jgi:hypothetical protein
MDIQTYFIIGIVFTALIDLGIYYTKSTSQFTLLEIVGSIIMWPIILIIVLYQMIKESK